jgi:hypothetical protein
MVAAHFLAVFSLVTMLGEWASLQFSTGALPRGSDVTARRAAFRRERALNRAPDPTSRNDRLAALDRERENLARDLSRRWAPFQALCFVIPLVGCLLSLWNLEMVSGPFPFREVGWPAIIAVAETLPLAVLAGAVSRNGRALLDRWRAFAEIPAPDGEDDIQPSSDLAQPPIKPARRLEPSEPHDELRELQPERRPQRPSEPNPETRDPERERPSMRSVAPLARSRGQEPEEQPPRPPERAMPPRPSGPQKTAASSTWPEREEASPPSRFPPSQQAPGPTDAPAPLSPPPKIPPVFKAPVEPESLEEDESSADSDDADEPRKKVEPRKRPDEDYY